MKAVSSFFKYWVQKSNSYKEVTQSREKVTITLVMDWRPSFMLIYLQQLKVVLTVVNKSLPDVKYVTPKVDYEDL